MEQHAYRLANTRFDVPPRPEALSAEPTRETVLLPNPVAGTEDVRQFEELRRLAGLQHVLRAIARRDPLFRSAWLTLCSMTPLAHGTMERKAGFQYFYLLGPLLVARFWPENAPELDLRYPPAQPKCYYEPPPPPPPSPPRRDPVVLAPAEGPLSVQVEGHGRVPCSVRCGGAMSIVHPISGAVKTIVAEESQVVSVTFSLNGAEITVDVSNAFVEVIGNRLVSTHFICERWFNFILNRFGGLDDTEVEILDDDGKWCVFVP
jgi:hypothetical protein